MKSAIQSLQDWWSLAGVDLDYKSQPESLLGIPVAENLPSLAHDSGSNVAKITKQAVAEIVEEKALNEDYPTEYVAFQHWLKEPANLLESEWARNLVFPEGSLEPEIMVISSMPELCGIENSQYYSTNETTLLKNMLSAIDVKWGQSFKTALSFGRTVDGRLTNEQINPLLKRTLNLISLVKPKQIIVFGDTASRALFQEDLLTARKKKQFINHVSSKTEAIVTFHPRILLERPELKAEAWKDLQMLTRITTS